MHSVSRRGWLLALASVPVVLGMTAPTLVVHLDGDYLRVSLASLPNLHFLMGKPLERLRDGATVGYLGRLTILTGESGPVQATAIERFAVSHDVFEEMDAGFKVSLVTPGRKDKLSKGKLSNLAAETWCLDQLKIDLARIPAGRPIWVRFEMTSEDQKEAAAGIIDNQGIILSKMVEVFSHPIRDEQIRLTEEIGPLRLEDLRKPRL
jgi:hypothetical protein